MEAKETKVLIVDDSAVARELLTYIVESDPNMKVISAVEDGEKALEVLEHQTPDVIILDIVMPKMDGFELTRRIMQTKAIPIIVVSGIYNRQEIAKSFQAMDAGALAILEKPKSVGDAQYIETARFVIETIKAISSIENISLEVSNYNTTKEKMVKEKPKLQSFKYQQNYEAIAIGGSVGGTQALSSILSELPANYPIPIFVVQHISPGFIQGLADWLNDITSLKIEIAKDKQKALPGHVYIAPTSHALEVTAENIISLHKLPHGESELTPISRLFHSMANVHGPYSIGILLSGMGKDGVKELLFMKEKGALTLAQDQKSCLVYDLPYAAIQIDAVKRIESSKQIAETLKEVAHIPSLHSEKDQ